MRALPLLLLLLQATPEPATFRVVSPEGRHYLVVSPGAAGEGRTPFALYRRAAEDPQPLPDDPAQPAPGDDALCKGTLDFRPTDAEVLDARAAALLAHGQGAGAAYTLLDPTGNVAWTRTAKEIVGPDDWKAVAQAGATAWAVAAWWIDDAQAWFVSALSHPFAIDLEDGARVEVDEEGTREALVRAARGARAAPVAIRALGGLGDDSAEALADLLATPGYRYRDDARVALTQLSTGAIVPALLEEFRDADRETAEQLLVSAIATGARDLHERFAPHESKLLQVLERAALPVEWLAEHFAVYPTSLAVAPLLRQLKRAAPGSARCRAIIASLRACTGQDWGDDRDAWLKNCRPPR